MDSRALIKKEVKEQPPVFHKNLSIFDRLPKVLQRKALSYLVGDNIERYKHISGFVAPSLEGSFFAECKASLISSAALKAIHNLAYRIKVDETLLFMQKNPGILQSLPFPIEVIDPRGLYGDRKVCAEYGSCGQWRAPRLLRNFCQTKTLALQSLCGHDPTPSVTGDNGEIRKSPSATAARQ